MATVSERGDDPCRHEWDHEQSERQFDVFMWWRVCKRCGEKRTTRTLFRGPDIRVYDQVHGVRYVISSKQNRAKEEFRYLVCDCGNTLRVDFELADHGRVTRTSCVVCDWCAGRFDKGNLGRADRPHAASWGDSPEVE